MNSTRAVSILAVALAACAAPAMAPIAQANVTGGRIAGTVVDGDPNGAGLPTWPAFTSADPLVMRFGVNRGPAPIPNQERLKILDVYYAWRRGGSHL